MGVQDAAAGVRDLMPQLRQDLEALVRIPSVSVPGRIDPPLLDAFELTSRLFADAGVAVGRLDLPDTAPVVTGEIPRSRGRADRAALQPLRRRAGGRRVAVDEPAVRADGARRGARRPRRADTKSNIVAHVGALRAWGGRPPVGIKLCIEGYEEIGSGALTSYPATDPERFQADALRDRRHGLDPARASRRSPRRCAGWRT